MKRTEKRTRSSEGSSPGSNGPSAAWLCAVIAIIALFLCACGTRRMATDSRVIRTDSVRTVETLRDTVVTVRADSSLIRALVECDSLGQAHLRRLEEYRAGERLPPPRVEIRDNVLTAAANIDSLEIYLQLKDRYRETVQVEESYKIEYVNRLTGWQKAWMRIGQAALLVAAAVVAWRAGTRR